MKIAVIGGAGVRTVIFINGLLKRYKKLHIDEVVLYDIQEEKQRIIEKLCKHVVEKPRRTESMGGIRSGGSRHWSRLYRNHIACRRRPFPCCR